MYYGNSMYKMNGTSLVVQWLTLWASNARGLGSVPVWEARSHMPQIKILYAVTKDQRSQVLAIKIRHSQINKHIFILKI